MVIQTQLLFSNCPQIGRGDTSHLHILSDLHDMTKGGTGHCRHSNGTFYGLNCALPKSIRSNYHYFRCDYI